MPLELFARAAIFWRLRATRMAPWVALAFLGACAPQPSLNAGPDPVDPAAPAPRMRARSFVESYVSRRPVEPSTRWFDAAPTTPRGAGQGR
jgi:hypothetical protein